MDLFRRKSVTDLQTEAASDHSLKRALSALNLTALGIGAIIGTGIFVLTGTVAALNSGPAVVLSFALAGVASIFAALCYSEFASLVPMAGSAYTYGYATLGELIAWIIGWDLVLEYALGAVTVAIGWSGYVVSFLHDIGINVPCALSAARNVTVQCADGTTATAIFNLPAVIIIGLVTTLLVIGIKESANTTSAMVVLKVGIILFFLAIGVFLINPENWNNPATGGFAPNGFKGISAAAAIIFFAYIGFDAVSTAAEETKNPARDMPFGIIMSLLICTVLYIALSAVMTGMAPWQTLGTPEPMITALQQAEGPPGLLTFSRFIIALGAVIAMGSVLMVFQLGQPRIFFSMSRDGLLPKFFSKVHPKFRTPYIGTIITGTFVATFAAFANIAEVVDLTNIGTLFAFVLVSAGVIFLRRTDPDRPRPFRVPWVPITPIISILACLYLMLQLPRITWIRFGVWLLLGLVIYFLYGYKHSALRNRPSA